MKRGWILFFSVIIEVVIILDTSLIPISLFWKIIIGVGLFFVAGFCLIYFSWAESNLFFTFVPEGRAKIIVRGDAFKKVLIQWDGYKLNKEWYVVEKQDKIKKGGKSKKRDRRFFGGLRFYGFWPLDDVYIYDFQWTGIKEDGDIDPHPKETLDFVLLKDDVYGLKEEKAEDKNLLPLNIVLALTVRIINPYKAIFNIQNWYETLINRLRPYVRDFITEDTYENLISQKKRIGTQIYKKLEDEKIFDEFLDRYGVDIRKIEVKEIDPGDEYRDATLAKYLAEMEKRKVVIGAEAESERLEKVYKKIEEFGGLGKFLRTLEALEKSPREGNKWIIPFPDELLSLFKGKGGDKK